MVNRSKDFTQEFYFFLDKIKNNTNFSFSRFSDGEMYMLQNKGIVLSSTQVKVEGIVNDRGPGHPSYDHKVFDPEQHSEFRDHLIESFLYQQPDYYKGISCKCCVGDVNWEWQLEQLEGDSDDLTWANLWVNSNYPLFMDLAYPEIKKRKAVVICNEDAQLDHLDWVIKDFRIGQNAFINDLDIIPKISKFIEDNNVQDTLFLFSASALSNLAIYELYKKHPNNTYIDIGTALSIEFKIPSHRDYLVQYYNKGANGVFLKCIW